MVQVTGGLPKEALGQITSSARIRRVGHRALEATSVPGKYTAAQVGRALSESSLRQRSSRYRMRLLVSQSLILRVSSAVRAHSDKAEGRESPPWCRGFI